jgi:hypothetical protein
MRKTIKYALFTCTLAYLIAAFLLFIFSIHQTGWSRIDNDIVTFLPDSLTLTLSESRWWGDFYYLAILVPWFGSTLVLNLLLHWFNKEARRRRLLGGLSILTYYLAVWLYLVIEELVRYGGHIRGDIGYAGYLMFLAWPAGGFGAGYLAAVVVERTLKPHFID